jgi:peroxiredoxin
VPNSRNTLLGMRVPGAMVAELEDGHVNPLTAHDVLFRGRSLVIGVPGAFTPLCTERHVPNLVQSAERLRRSGFDHLVCFVASDPFVTQAWQRVVDPKGWIRFVSDGNLNFCRALGLNTHEQSLFLGDRSERYLMIVQDGIIEKVRVEQRITDYSCTRPSDFVLENI